jgi:hypothetical protein
VTMSRTFSFFNAGNACGSLSTLRFSG